MEHRFRLHPHEVWREGLVREGVYSQSADFADVLPKGVWNESRFVFSRYNARKGEETLTGNTLFRPEHGAEDENFLLATDAMGGMRGMGGPFFCKLGEFIFGSERVDKKQIVAALEKHQWGRVFYFDDNLRADGAEVPCDWGVFLAANGMGLWKWTMRDGVTWGKASNEGIFRWHHNPQSAARFLTTHSSSEVWRQFQLQLADSKSDAAFSRRWLQSEEDERLRTLLVFENGSLQEWEMVVRWLLLRELTLQKVKSVRFWGCIIDADADYHLLSYEEGFCAESQRLKRGMRQIQGYFSPGLEQSFLCTQFYFTDANVEIHITEPTAHERLEAQLQLTQWARERGLSFD